MAIVAWSIDLTLEGQDSSKGGPLLGGQVKCRHSRLA
jgi:hypothetical protein